MNFLLLSAVLLTTGGAKNGAMMDAKDEASLKTMVSTVGAAFDKCDGKMVAEQFAEDSTCMNPMGKFGKGRGECEKIIQADCDTILKGTHSTMTMERAMPVGKDMAWMDLTHGVTGMKGPDGKDMPEHKIAVTVLAMKHKDKWMVMHVRPSQMPPMPMPQPMKTN